MFAHYILDGSKAELARAKGVSNAAIGELLLNYQRRECTMIVYGWYDLRIYLTQRREYYGNFGQTVRRYGCEVVYAEE